MESLTLWARCVVRRATKNIHDEQLTPFMQASADLVASNIDWGVEARRSA